MALNFEFGNSGSITVKIMQIALAVIQSVIFLKQSYEWDLRLPYICWQQCSFGMSLKRKIS